MNALAGPAPPVLLVFQVGVGVSRLFCFWGFLQQQQFVAVVCCLRMDEFERRSKKNPSLLYQSSRDLKKKKKMHS